MPTIDWAFLCDYAFVDAAGKASIIGTLESLTTFNLPTTQNQLYVALGIKVAPGDGFELSARISSPIGKENAQIPPQKITAPSDASDIQGGVVIFSFYQTQFSEVGEHRIEIFLDGNSIHVIPLHVILRHRKP